MVTQIYAASIFAPVSAQSSIWLGPLVAFGAALFVVLSAASWFTSSLEALSDQGHFSAGLLALLGAVGANVPNYAASLTVSFERQATVAQGIIIGSSIYNVTIILALVAFAVPSRRGIVLRRAEERDVFQVGRLAFATAVTTLLCVGILVFLHGKLATSLAVGISLVTLGLFALLAMHALRRGKDQGQEAATTPAADPASHKEAMSSSLRNVAKVLVALALTLGGVVFMVQAGQSLAVDLHLPETFYSLVFLAIATSLPNTVVAYQLARTHRDVAAVEEILSSNGVNLALGSALPLILLPTLLSGASVLFADAAFLVALHIIVLLSLRRGIITRALAGGFLLAYVAWVVLHLLVTGL